MKILFIIYLVLLTNIVSFSDDTIIDNQKEIIYDFIDMFKSDLFTIQQYHKFFGIGSEYEKLHLDKYCYLNNIDKDSCFQLQKNYCMDPNNKSFTLTYLKDNFFNEIIIRNIEVIKEESCLIYKVIINNTDKNNHYYFKFSKADRKSYQIINIYNECFNSILIG